MSLIELELTVKELTQVLDTENNTHVMVYNLVSLLLNSISNRVTCS